jgi:hypothetical protein
MIFLRSFEKIKKKLKNIPHLKKNKKSFVFHAYGQILKVFHAYFLKRIKSYFYHVLKMQNGYHNWSMIIH